METKELIEKLLNIVKAGEWQIHHAAENTYCPFCVTEDESWEDQKVHHEGCEFVALVSAANEWLANNASTRQGRA